MSKGRLEAFSDGVMAIIITIMVLELRVPEGGDLAALWEMLPTLAGYGLSFVFLGIYWNNHHHLLQAARQVDGRVLWANLHLLFWLSLIPFGMAWVGETGFATLPTAVYGVILLLSAVAYFMLTRALVALHGADSLLGKAVDQDVKGKLSLILCFAAIPLTFVSRWLAGGVYVLVALLWLIPDPRIERKLGE